MAQIGDERVRPVGLDAVEAVLRLRITERFTVEVAAHQGHEHVRRIACERHVDRTADVAVWERFRRQPVGVRGRVSGASVDAQHCAGHAVRYVERPVGTDRASGDEVIAAELGERRHHRTSLVVSTDRLDSRGVRRRGDTSLRDRIRDRRGA